VLVADDHPEMRLRIAAVLGQACDVVGTAADGPSTLHAIAALQPDVVVLDVSMPKMSGLEVAERLRREGSPVRIVLCSAHDDEDFRLAAKSLGASAFVPKPRLDELLAAIIE